MRIALNGLELSKNAEGQQTVGDVLGELRREAQAGRKLITEIRLDGRSLNNHPARDLELTRPVSSVQRLDLRIENAADLRAGALAQTEQLAQQLQQKCKPISRKFRIGDVASASADLALCLDELHLIAQGLDQSLRLMDDPALATRRQKQVTQAAELLAPTLDDIYQAQSTGDYIAVADDIEYDLAEQLTRWRDLCRTFKNAETAPEQVG